MLISEIWPRLSAKTFYEGDVLKSYDVHPLDIYIIFDGEASVVTRIQKRDTNEQDIQDKTLVNEITLNRFGPQTLLGDS